MGLRVLRPWTKSKVRPLAPCSFKTPKQPCRTVRESSSLSFQFLPKIGWLFATIADRGMTIRSAQSGDINGDTGMGITR